MKHTFDTRDSDCTYCLSCNEFVKGETQKARQGAEDCKVDEGKPRQFA
jgi:hypothetical protein